MGMLQEFKDFAMKGNVVDLAVGVIIGAAFGKIVTSLVNDLIMPPMSTSTAAPAARSRSEGSKLLMKGTATNPAPMAPAQPDAMIQVRLPPSIFWSLILI